MHYEIGRQSDLWRIAGIFSKRRDPCFLGQRNACHEPEHSYLGKDVPQHTHGCRKADQAGSAWVQDEQ
jgi:hypothetical protein